MSDEQTIVYIYFPGAKLELTGTNIKSTQGLKIPPKCLIRIIEIIPQKWLDGVYEHSIPIFDKMR